MGEPVMAAAIGAIAIGIIQPQVALWMADLFPVMRQPDHKQRSVTRRQTDA
jgi:hypothetical protein